MHTLEDAMEQLAKFTSIIDDLRKQVNGQAGGRELAIVGTKSDEARLWLMEASMKIRVETGRVNDGR